MVTLRRTDSHDADFLQLVNDLNAELTIINGEQDAFYAQYNGLEAIRHVVMAYLDGQPVGCGAFKPYEAGTVEVKRMYTVPAARQRGVGRQILRELETWAVELGMHTCVLETSIRQPDALALYQKSGYAVTPNYGQYVGVAESVCFAKQLAQ